MRRPRRRSPGPNPRRRSSARSSSTGTRSGAGPSCIASGRGSGGAACRRCSPSMAAARAARSPPPRLHGPRWTDRRKRPASAGKRPRRGSAPAQRQRMRRIERQPLQYVSHAFLAFCRSSSVPNSSSASTGMALVFSTSMYLDTMSVVRSLAAPFLARE